MSPVVLCSSGHQSDLLLGQSIQSSHLVWWPVSVGGLDFEY